MRLGGMFGAIPTAPEVSTSHRMLFDLPFTYEITILNVKSNADGGGGETMGWKRLLACSIGSVKQELFLRNKSLVTENRLLCQQIPDRVQLRTGERKALAAIGKRLGEKTLAEVATIVTPETVLAWHRKLVAQKFDGSQ